jgi:hypothetical protein
MAAVMIGGFVLFVVGLAGAVNACLAGPDGGDTTTATVSGLLFALGLSMLAVGAAKRGYHRRPLGAPPGDMDPDKATSPTPQDEARIR